MMNYIFLFLIIIFLPCINLFSTDKVFLDEFISGGSLLGGRTTALGNTGVSIADDASAVFYNPSLMLNLPVNTINLEKATLLYETDLNCLSYVKPGEKNWFGFSYINMQPDNSYFIQRDINGKSNGTFDVSDKSYIFAYARKIRVFDKVCNFGTNIKYIDKTVGSLGGNCFDFSLAMNNILSDKLGYGILVENILASKIGDDNLPRRLNIGAYYKAYSSLLFSVQTNFSESEFEYRGGIEYNFKNYVYIRSGYENSRMSYGLGLKFSDFEFNYVIKTVSAEDINENLSMISFNWKIGLNKRMRIQKYEKLAEQARDFLNQENYKKAIDYMNEAIAILKPGADKEQFKVISYLKENAQIIYENQQKEIEVRQKRSAEYFNKGKKLLEQKEYELAKSEFSRIDPDFQFFDEVKQFINKCDEQIRQLKLNEDVNVNLTMWQDEYNRAKDLNYKVRVGEKILQIKSDKSLKEEIDQLKKVIAAKKIIVNDEKITSDFENLQFEVNKQRAEDNLKKIKKYVELGYFELARDELLETQKLIKDENWQAKLLNEINIKITKQKEEEAFDKTVKTLFDDGFKDFVQAKYSNALTKITKLLELKKDYPGAKNLYDRIKSELDKSGQKPAVKVERTLTEAEIQLRKAKIDRLYQEGLSLYISGNIAGAREKWQQILDIDPDNEKVKQYLKVIK